MRPTLPNDRLVTLLRTASAFASGGTLFMFAFWDHFADSGLTTRLNPFATDAAPAWLMTTWLCLSIWSSLFLGHKLALRLIAAFAVLCLVYVFGMAVAAPSLTNRVELVPSLAVWLFMYGHIVTHTPSHEVTRLPGPSIEDDTRCTCCGYNLRTLTISSRCPECGQPIEHSISSDIQTLSSGSHATNLGIGSLVIALLCLLWVALDITIKVPQLWRILWAFIPAMVVWTQMVIAAALVAGWWIITTRNRHAAKQYDPASRRLTLWLVATSAMWYLTSMIGFVATQQRWGAWQWYWVFPQITGNRLALVGDALFTFSLWFLITYLGKHIPIRHGEWLRAFSLLMLAATPMNPVLQYCIDSAVTYQLPVSAMYPVLIAIDICQSNLLAVWLGAYLLTFYYYIRKQLPQHTLPTALGHQCDSTSPAAIIFKSSA